MIIRKSSRELERMREAGRLTAEAHRLVAEAVAPGVTTEELDQIVFDFIQSQGAEPAFLGYHGFPASICASINEQIVHGIPSERELEEGDIISIDIGVVYEGYVGDAAQTLPVGKVSEAKQQLMKTTSEALEAAIDKARTGNRLSDISHAVEQVAEPQGYGIVREYGGHGVGAQMHEDPFVPNFGEPGRGPRLKKGMCLALEPMLNLGTHETGVLEDGWTVVTVDGQPSAHFEHSVAITDEGPIILTLP